MLEAILFCPEARDQYYLLSQKGETQPITYSTPQPCVVTSDAHVTQVNMNVNIPTPQPSDVTSDVHVTQVNMNVNIPTPPTQWRNIRCACDASEHER